MRVALNGTTIYFDIEGAELRVVGEQLVERPTILALPGGPGFSHGYLRAGLSPLSEHARIVYVDPRAHGRSGRPPLDTCSTEQMADDVAALCELLDLERPVLFGHSAGGVIALRAALRHPSRIGGLILCDAAATFAPQPSDQPQPTLASRATPEVLALVGRFFGGDMSDATLQLFIEKVSPYYAAPTRMQLAPAVFGLSTMSGDILRHFFRTEAGSLDLRPSLASIRTPTLVIGGRHDWVCTPAASRALAEGIPGAKHVVLEESCHLGFAEEPEAFQRAVRAFLSTLEASS